MYFLAHPNVLTKTGFTWDRGPIYAAFTHASLTARYRIKSLYKSILCCQSHAIYTFWRG